MPGTADSAVIVTYRDGRQVKGWTTPYDAILFERHFDVPATILANPAACRLEHTAWMAHRAMRNAHSDGEHEGPFKPDFDPWMQLLDRIEFPDEDETDEDPTGRDLSTG